MLLRICFTTLTTLLIAFWGITQEPYDDCLQAALICPGTTFSASSIDATEQTCPGCQDDYNTCFVPSSTVWFKFYTNEFGGNVSVDITNLNFLLEPGRAQALDAIFVSASIPCNPTTYLPVGACVNNQTTDFSITNVPALDPNTWYYVFISGVATGAGISLPAQASFDISVSGPAVTTQPLDPTIGTTTTSICPEEAVEVWSEFTNCTDSSRIEWLINGEFFTGDDDTIVVADLQNGDSLSMVVSCNLGCTYTDTSNVLVFNVPELNVDAGPDFEIQPGETVTLQGSGTGVLTWSPDLWLSDPSIATPTASPENTTVYTLSATVDSCTVTDEAVVFVNTLVTIPQAFTPNDDGSNDLLEILNVENYPNNSLTIYDRWGQRVFFDRSYGTGDLWDGTRSGKPVGEGVYFYVLDLGIGDEGVFKGYVTVIR